ncbi:MAG: hypothetical protein JNL94_11265 [Planctomycetes bacterium]|nr:hypothetical protein [Planctomycetota bacterium]
MSSVRNANQINGALFSKRSLDSSELAVRAALGHRFDRPGKFDVFVERDGRLVHREAVEVADDGRIPQRDVDLARLADARSCDCEHDGAPRDRLVTNGFMVFSVSHGFGRYHVRIERWDASSRETVLDQRQSLPAGDLFIAVLVEAGSYAVLVDKATVATIRVREPNPKRPHRTDVPLFLELPSKPKPQAHEIDAGCSVVIQLAHAARVRIEAIERSD